MLPNEVPQSFPAPGLAAEIARSSRGRISSARAQSLIDRSLEQGFRNAIEHGHGVVPWLGIIYVRDREGYTQFAVVPLPEFRVCGDEQQPRLDGRVVDAILARHTERCPSPDRVRELIGLIPGWIRVIPGWMRAHGEAREAPSGLPPVLQALYGTSTWYWGRQLADPSRDALEGVAFATDDQFVWAFDARQTRSVSACSTTQCGFRRTTPEQFAASLLLSTDLFAAMSAIGENDELVQRFGLSSEDWLRAAAQLAALDPSTNISSHDRDLLQ
jgi:hypothetical protein